MTPPLSPNFDVLIVGAGSAGCVLAARLSENPRIRVGVLEAGGPATDPDIAIPQKWPLLAGRDYDWAYRTTPQAGTAGRAHDWPRGRLIGGSGCLNAMAPCAGPGRISAPGPTPRVLRAGRTRVCCPPSAGPR